MPTQPDAAEMAPGDRLRRWNKMFQRSAVEPRGRIMSMDAEQRKQIEQRRAAIAVLLRQDPPLVQREIARRVGASEKTIRRDVEAMRREADSASHAAAQRESGLPTAGEKYRQRMDDELARLAGVIGAELCWSVAEVETLRAIAAAMDRRAAMLAAWPSCEDPLAQRALDAAARELRLVERQITSMTNALSDGLSKLLSQHQSERAKQEQPESIRTIKARRAVNSRWRREALRQAALERRQVAEVEHA
jgi:hypothetical protein